MTIRARVATLAIAALAWAAPASAQIVQSINVGFGAFFPRGFDSRVRGDVLVEDLTTFDPLLFDIGEFKAGQFFGEWNIQFNRHFEVGTGLGYYSETVPSIYRDTVNELPNGVRVEIPQDLRLRMSPLSAVLRVVAGREGGIQPYVGGGVAALFWQYSEIGDFVDTTEGTVFSDRYVASGTAPAGLFIMGVRWPIGGDIYGLTTEWRYQFASGNTGGPAAGFLNDKIDLSGGQLNFGFTVRF
jgi:hypothetical protein